MAVQRLTCALRSALCALIFVGCATQPKAPMVPPSWTTVPPAILDAFCAKLRSEAMISDAPIAIVSTTQPLVTGASLRSVAHLYGKDAEVSSAAQLINSSLQPLPINSADAHNCSWTPLAKIDPVQQVQTMVVELSPPFVNPFTKHEAGMLARFSLGGHDAQWYWIPLGERNGVWAIGNIFAIDNHE